MSFEADLTAAVGALCGGRCYPDFAPLGVARPYVVYTQVGGPSVQFLEGGPAPAHMARVQINVWHDTRLAANALMRQIDDLLRAAPWQGTPQGELMARADEASQLRGAQQDFMLRAA